MQQWHGRFCLLFTEQHFTQMQRENRKWGFWLLPRGIKNQGGRYTTVFVAYTGPWFYSWGPSHQMALCPSTMKRGLSYHTRKVGWGLRRKQELRRWFIRMLAAHMWGLEFIPHHPCKSWAWCCVSVIPAPGDRGERSLELAGQSS